MSEPKIHEIGPIRLQYGELRVGYMNKVGFDEELGNALTGNKIFPSIESLEKSDPGVTTCGIVEVEVRLRQVIQETDFKG